MCDRTKTEVLARELCIERWVGITWDSTRHMPNIEEYTESNWKNFERSADRILEILEKHK